MKSGKDESREAITLTLDDVGTIDLVEKSLSPDEMQGLVDFAIRTPVSRPGAREREE